MYGFMVYSQHFTKSTSDRQNKHTVLVKARHSVFKEREPLEH